MSDTSFAIALFDEPPRVTVNQDGLDIRYGLLLGLSCGPGGFDGVVIDEEGGIRRLPVNTFSIDYRYDVETDRWIDQNAQPPAQPDQEG